MPSVGSGVREVRVSDQSGAFRVIYIATRPEAVYVLHAFQKKTQATAKRDLDLAETRLKELTRSKSSVKRTTSPGKCSQAFGMRWRTARPRLPTCACVPS